jgi:hypothetical protein
MQLFEGFTNSSPRRRRVEPVGAAFCESVIKTLLLAVGFVCPMWASPQQILLSAGTVGAFTIPTSPYSTVTSWRLEGRETIPIIPSNGVYNLITGIGSYQVTVGFGVLLVLDYQDGIPFNAFSVPIVAGEDFVWRLQKNAVTRVFSFEKWKVDGSNYQVGTAVMSAPVAGLSGTWSIGNAAAGVGTLAFLRAYSSTVPLNSKPPFGSSGGDLGDWEFNGNGNDSSGHGNNFLGLGGATYSSAATYAPACILPPQTTFRAGTALTALTAANSFPLDGGETLTYLWQQIPNKLTGLTTSVTQFSSQTDVNPTLQGLIAGSYTMQLTVTDSSGQHTTCSTKYGAVATDANGSVIISNPVHAQILGPLIASFASPWAAEPQQHLAFANLIIQKMTNPNVAVCPPSAAPCQFQFFDFWNQAAPGTVTVANGSQAVVGVGTTFKATFGGGTTTPVDAQTSIVVWYPINNTFGFTGQFGRRLGVVTAITDDTHLTASFPTGGPSNWVTDNYIGAGSGLSYSYVEQAGGAATNSIAGWQVGAYPGNYYSNVKALYAAWYRTGIDDYLIAARTLADRWFSSPAIDKGITAETSTNGSPWGSILLQQRSMELTGLFLRNADSPPYDYDPGIRSYINYLIGRGTPAGSFTAICPTGPSITTCGQDVREQGYALGWVALYALFGEDSATVTAALAALSRDMNNRWGQCQILSSTSNGICSNVDGLGINQAGYRASWTGNTDATVTSGSNVVVGNWSSGDFLAPIVITSATAANPMVLTLATTAPTYWADNGTIITIAGATGTGCSIMNGPQTVTNVSTNQVQLTLNGSGCTYTANSASADTPTVIWFTSTGTTQPVSNLQGDAGWYYAVYADATHIHLTQADGVTPVAYSGSQSGSGVGWQLINYANTIQGGQWLGYTWQPYMTGILNQAYWWVALALASSDATNAANASTWAQNNANAMATTGLNISIQSGHTTNGPYYAIGITCPGGGPGAIYVPATCDSGLTGDRDLNSETLNVATIALRFNPASATDLTLGNTMMAAMYAQSGEPGYDGANILSDMVSPGFMYTGNAQHKWFGAFWGVGADWSWAATRLGGLRPPIPRVVQVSLDFQTASQAVLTVVRPDGTSSQVTCTSSPCSITIDSREGDHLLFIKYLNPANQVLLPAEQTIVKAR